MRTASAFFSKPLFYVWLTVTVVISGLMCIAPLTNSLGFEYAFFSGIYLSIAAGHFAAIYPSRIRNQLSPFPGASFPMLRLYFQSGVPAALLTATALILSAVNLIRVPACNFNMGLFFFLMLPVYSVALSITGGLFMGILFRTKKLAVFGWFFLWFTAAAFALRELYSTPAVFAYGPFFGYWPGVLYDKSIEIEMSFFTYRISNTVWAFAFLLLMHNGLNKSTMCLSIPQLLKQRNKNLTIVILAAIGTLFWFFGPNLHHRSSTEILQTALPHRLGTSDLELYFDDGIPKTEQQQLVEDAQFSLHRVKEALGVKTVRPLKVFIFKNAEQKQLWMGAKHTSVAKPWLGQTYIVASQSPHWILRHELAHLVAANFADGPFSVAGSMGGWIPNPGLIEGLATAATPAQGVMNLHQRASGMLTLNMLPSVKQLFGISFLGLYSHSAYTAAGSFCRFFRETFGTKAMQKLYAGQSISAITRKSIDDVEQQWKRALQQVPVTDTQKEQISYLYDRPSIVASRCVREVTRLELNATELTILGHTNQALEILRKAHRVSGFSTDTNMTLLFATADCHNISDTEKLGRQLLTKNPGVVNRQKINELLIDNQLDQFPPTVLSQKYQTLYRQALDEPDQRRIYIKEYLISHFGTHGKKLVQFLSPISYPDKPDELDALFKLTLLLQTHSNDGILRYLQARILFQHRSFHHSAQMMKQALSHLHSAPTVVQKEARFTLAQSYIRLKQYGAAQTQLNQLKTLSSDDLGSTEQIEDWLARITWLRHQE